ncbi:MAG TPA: iron chelate uptake ABC transporter family permease subunit [Alphaproteobacteria bacterium]|nr:iron chelate uptake ABC transporter family permease subunit [Alphaproteobacteria bacterium]
MIADFIASWALFHNTYVVGWLISLVLALIGVLVVARDQIFIGAAVSQASTLGIALALWVGSWPALEGVHWLHTDVFLATMAVASSVIAALLTAHGGATGKESHEAITGWVFLVSASLSILIVAHSPHGLDEIHRLLSSSIIGARPSDVWIFSALFSITALTIYLYHRPILLFSMDPATAAATGVNVTLISILISAWLGLAVGLSIRVAGMLYTFGCLVLPALVAKNACREVRPMFLVAPAVAVATATTGFVLANHYDHPPAQLTVALLCLLLAMAWVLRWLGLVRPAA